MHIQKGIQAFSGRADADLRTLFNSDPRNKKVTLGSASRTRRDLLQELADVYGFSFDILTADLDERSIGDRAASPEHLVTLLAKAKADALMPQLMDRPAHERPRFLITCDQVVVHKGKVLEKPQNADEVRQFVSGYSAAPPSTVGSVLVQDISSGGQYSAVDSTTVHFQPIPDDTIEQLIQEGTVFSCAGGLMIEHPLVTPLILSIEGTRDSIMGLPQKLVLEGFLSAAHPKP
ncbi:g8265 [Coccomyxa viridis]|uniref:G8265 protein n=1 Tax=Coccomyxa viridis TaxID=1274662 RepID=A0ABP1G6F7_9CHLO